MVRLGLLAAFPGLAMLLQQSRTGAVEFGGTITVLCPSWLLGICSYLACPHWD